MAITFAAGAGEATLRIQWEDARGETMVQNIALDPDTTSAEAIAIITSLETLSNARIVSAKLFTGVAASGFRANAIDAVADIVAARLGLTFGKTNPVNPNTDVVRSVIIPAYVRALVSTDNKPVDNNATLNALITSLSGRLTMTGTDGAYYPGGWLYDRSKSAFFTIPSVQDGQ